jgi:hypothetical protein
MQPAFVRDVSSRASTTAPSSSLIINSSSQVVNRTFPRLLLDRLGAPFVLVQRCHKVFIVNPSVFDCVDCGGLCDVLLANTEIEMAHRAL